MKRGALLCKLREDQPAYATSRRRRVFSPRFPNTLARKITRRKADKECANQQYKLDRKRGILVLSTQQCWRRAWPRRSSGIREKASCGRRALGDAAVVSCGVGGSASLRASWVLRRSANEGADGSLRQWSVRMCVSTLAGSFLCILKRDDVPGGERKGMPRSCSRRLRAASKGSLARFLGRLLFGMGKF